MRLICILVAVLAVTNCRPRTQSQADSDVSNIQVTDLHGKDFELGPKELVLTLDDGPGEGTKAIVDFLKKRKVPATFFMIGKNVQQAQYKNLLKEMAAEPLFLLGNHSMNHSKPLNSSADWAISEVREADKLITPLIGAHQNLRLMRPPYGALIGNKALIASLNEGTDTMGGKLSKYIGPIKWDIGGAVTKVSAADWACWTEAKLSVAVCRARYMKEIEAKKSGIILVHDINKKTAEMLIGDGKKTGLIDLALAKGYKFVPINKIGDDVLVKKYGGQGKPAAKPEAFAEKLQIINETVDGFGIAVTAKSARHLQFFVNGDLKERAAGPSATFNFTSTPGDYEVSIKGFKKDSDEQPILDQSFNYRIGGHAG